VRKGCAFPSTSLSNIEAAPLSGGIASGELRERDGKPEAFRTEGGGAAVGVSTRSAKDAKCESLGQRAQVGDVGICLSAEGAELWSGLFRPVGAKRFLGGLVIPG
jgi:hypothetical protein